MPDSVDSVFDKIIDHAHETVTKKKRADREKQMERLAKAESDSLEFDGWDQHAKESSDSLKSDASGSNGQRSASESSSNVVPTIPKITTPKFSPKDLLDRMPDLSGVNPKHVFLIMGAIGLTVLMAYFLLQALAGDGETIRSRRASRRLRNAVIQSPKDLVDAVDQFLITKFGLQSSWWNDQHARRRLSTDAPEFSAKINDLLQDYVRARYMRSEVRLSESEQARYKQTLQELAKITSKSKPGNPVLAAEPVPVKG